MLTTYIFFAGTTVRFCFVAVEHCKVVFPCHQQQRVCIVYGESDDNFQIGGKNRNVRFFVAVWMWCGSHSLIYGIENNRKLNQNAVWDEDISADGFRWESV
jgi:hypothetical protein